MSRPNRRVSCGQHRAYLKSYPTPYISMDTRTRIIVAAELAAQGLSISEIARQLEFTTQ